MNPLLLALLGPLKGLVEQTITEETTRLLRTGLRLIEDALSGKANDEAIFNWLEEYARHGKA